MKKLLLPMAILSILLSPLGVQATKGVFNDNDASALMSKAKEGGVSSDLANMLSKMKNYKPRDAIYIPTGGLYFFEDERSQLMAVTTDGRYSITGGSLVDIVKRKPVLSVDEIRKSYFIKLSDAPFQLDTASVIPLGNPKLARQAALFITLDCDGCQELVKHFYENREKYRVDIVLVPSPEVKDDLRQLWCSKEKGKINNLDILRWIMGERSEVNKRLIPLKEAAQCEAQPLVASLMLAGIYKLQGVPSVVREDGLAGNGVPKDFDAWLKQSITPLLKNPFETK